MHIEAFREFCLSLPNVEETTPFGDEYLVYKIGGKMFTITSIELFDHFAVKCDPSLAIELRERYAAITSAWHFNKKHWNDVYVNQDLDDSLLKQQIVQSYLLVLRKNVTPKALRDKLLQAYLQTNK